MLELKACRVCFSTDVKLCNLDTGQLRQFFNVISGLQTHERIGMPDYLCVECSGYVKRCMKFRLKCQTANYVLREIIGRKSEIKIEDLKAIDRNTLDIAPTLSYVNLSKVHFEEVKFQWTRPNRLGVANKVDIPVVNYNDKEDEKVKIEKHQDGVHNDDDANMDDDFNNDIWGEGPDNSANKNNKTDADIVDGSELDTEYAKLYIISAKEAKAVAEIGRMFSNGKFKCNVCAKCFNSESRLNIHLRMHDTHISGAYQCDICMYYYKTEFMLSTHMTDKHMYKYVCTKCPDVNFTRVSAKHHYTYSHLDKSQISGSRWTQMRPEWLDPRGGKRTKGVTIKAKKKLPCKPADFPLKEAVSQEEQYRLLLERRSSRNYLESQFKCELCFKGFRVLDTYNKHMTKHDPVRSGKYQCDICKMFFKDTRKMYKHMIISHVIKYSCQLCKHVCYNRNQAIMHYKWHKNVTYKCPHCDKVFSKISTHLTHIRIKHPSSFMCNLCGHSFVSETGLYCHKRITHTPEETQLSAAAHDDTSHPLYCAECRMLFLSERAFATHLGSSSRHAATNLSIKAKIRDTKRLGDKRTGAGRRGRPSRSGHSDIINNGLATSTACELCGKYLPNDVQTRHHYETEHPGHDYLKRYMCDVCGHTTKQYANLVVHMRTHTNEKPYDCPHCDRRFSMGSNRDRHLVVHTGEKRYQCQHCSRRFTQSSAVKLHIQTVHMKIPYAPWDKKNRKRRKNREGSSAPVSSVAPAAFPPQQKLILDAQGDYLNAYINYNE
ncbi:zinc finger protein 420-like [Plodia interpunctella]|uniref:zinc finger protein 420-like n=1 Tax=Plodia interpunctella TaxID=58824 RepID=UPI002367A77C|nr:zinc finger protein 420-like [Plodia interpunctella]